jgi:hypothetical protein
MLPGQLISATNNKTTTLIYENEWAKDYIILFSMNIAAHNEHKQLKMEQNRNYGIHKTVHTE